MTPEEVRAYALGRPGAWLDQPWDGDDVAKVGGRIFAFLGRDAVGVKCGTRAEADEWLAEFPDDVTVMAYIGRHGWNTVRISGAVPDDVLREGIEESYARVVAALPKRDRPGAAGATPGG